MVACPDEDCLKRKRFGTAQEDRLRPGNLWICAALASGFGGEGEARFEAVALVQSYPNVDAEEVG